MINEAYLNKIRGVANFYQLPTVVKIYRASIESDGSGGTKINYNQFIAQCNVRVTNKIFEEKQVGEGLVGTSKWYFVLPASVDLQVEDRIVIDNDTDSNKYYLVINHDRSSTEGLFTNCEAIERYN